MKSNILAIRFSSLGDVILTSATVLNLKISFPESRLTFLTRERYHSTVSLFDGVDEIITLPENAAHLDYIKLLLKLDSCNFDTIVDLHGNFRSWLAKKIITASAKTVYPKRRFERASLVKRHRIPEVWPHTIDQYNRCVEELGGKAVCRRPVIHPPELDANLSVKINPLIEKGRMVVIAPGAAHPNKQWPVERFVEVAAQLHRSHGVSIIWAVVAKENGKTLLENKIPADAVVELVDCPVEQLAAVIARAALTVANDSGVAHLSSAVGTPVVAVFGPTHPALGFTPRGLFDRVVEVDEPCRPCSLHGKTSCYRDERYCFTRIAPEMVFDAADKILKMRIETTRALFVDRDGTIIVDKNFLADPDQIEFLPGAVEALKKAKTMGFKLVILTNQSGVARGLFSVDDVEHMNNRLLELLAARGVEIDGFYICPHVPWGVVDEYAVVCNCRKPAPAMAEEAARQLHIDLRRSYVIGDKCDDFNLGRVIGARSYLVRTGHGAQQEHQLHRYGITNRDQAVFDDLLSAVNHIAQRENHA
jgi:D,D-heptose 1,7-bisphosphate phosphatase